MPSRVEIGAVLLASPTPEKLAEFYRRAFGLGAVRAQGPDHLGVSAGNIYLGFDRARRPPKAPGRATVWFRVPDADRTYRRLLSLGAKGVMPPDRDCSPGEVLAWLLDPEGNAIGILSEAKRKRPRR